MGYSILLNLQFLFFFLLLCFSWSRVSLILAKKSFLWLYLCELLSYFFFIIKCFKWSFFICFLHFSKRLVWYSGKNVGSRILRPWAKLIYPFWYYRYSYWETHLYYPPCFLLLLCQLKCWCPSWLCRPLCEDDKTHSHLPHCPQLDFMEIKRKKLLSCKPLRFQSLSIITTNIIMAKPAQTGFILFL